MNVTISERAKKILRILASGEALPRAAIAEAIGETRINTIRELNRLVEQKLVATFGEARATSFGIAASIVATLVIRQKTAPANIDSTAAA